MNWLFEAKKRYGLSILNYMVTSNHIHLLVSDDGERETIPKSIQLIAGKTGQEYNRRKKRKGAFWEDRYHATAVEGDDHLGQCMVYIDTNMVRAGVVKHPREWTFCGYHEIQNPRKRYRRIDYQRLLAILQMRDFKELQESIRYWVQDAIGSRNYGRDRKWTESIAVGSKGYVDVIKERLGIKARGRKVVGENGIYEIREPDAPYKGYFGTENDVLRLENSYIWNVFP